MEPLWKTTVPVGFAVPVDAVTVAVKLTLAPCLMLVAEAEIFVVVEISELAATDTLTAGEVEALFVELPP